MDHSCSTAYMTGGSSVIREPGRKFVRPEGHTRGDLATNDGTPGLSVKQLDIILTGCDAMLSSRDRTCIWAEHGLF